MWMDRLTEPSWECTQASCQCVCWVSICAYCTVCTPVPFVRAPWWQRWKVGTRSPVVWGLFNAQDWRRMGRICFLVRPLLRDVTGVESSSKIHVGHICPLTWDSHVPFGPIHPVHPMVCMSVWSDSQQQMVYDILMLVVVWGLRNSNIIQIFEKIAKNYAKLIGQHMRSFAHGVPLKGRSDPRGLVAAP